MSKKTTEFFTGIRDETPILLGVIPFGLIYGVLARSVGIPAILAQMMSLVIFAGSAQFVTAQLVGAGIPGIIIVLTAFVLNLRHALYSASLAPYLKRLSLLWRMLLAYLLTDEAYAVIITHYQKEPEAPYKHWYSLGAGLALWITWQSSTAIGIQLGASIPASWSLDFAAPLTFIALVVPNLKDRPGVAAAIAASLIALLAVNVPLKLGLLIAAFVGVLVGLCLEPKSKHRLQERQYEMAETRSSIEHTAPTDFVEGDAP